MKKILILSLIFILCGCSSKQNLYCVKEETDKNNLTTKYEYSIEYDTYVTKVKKIDSIELDKALIDFTFNSKKELASRFDNIKGIKVNVKIINDNVIQTVTTINYKKLDKEELEKNNLSTNALYNKKLKLDKFKDYYLKDFDCK